MADKLIFPLQTLYCRVFQFYKERLEFYQEEGSVPCTDATDRNIYLRNPEVRDALHIPEHVHDWVFCR